MKGWPLAVIGALVFVVGAIWGLQGVGVLKGSPMTGVALWAVVGPVVALAGLAVAALGVRQIRR